MFVRVKLTNDLPLGTIVSYNSALDSWEIASDNTKMFGIIEETPTQEVELGGPPYVSGVFLGR